MSSQSVVLLIMGVSGSGKSLIGSLLADKLGFHFIDADQYHTPANKAKMHSGRPLDDRDRMPWLELLARLVNEWVKKDENGIIACSALKEKYRKIILASTKQNYIIYLKGNYELIADRIIRRQHPFMNPNLLQSQFAILEEPENAICLDIAQSPEQIVESAYEKLKETLKTHFNFLV